ncbi:MAG: hypothetical protein ACYTG0_01855 [Planctomycetota bacterium]|jgi:hypothetical protein
MTRTDDLERLIEEYRVTTDAALDRRILDDAESAMPQPGGAAASRFWIWSTVMKSPWTQSAAVATIAVVAVLALTFILPTSTPTYALEQTIEANRAVRTVHVRNESPPAPEPQDSWLEFDDAGRVYRLRVEEGLEASFRIMVWADGELRWFSPAKKEMVILHETTGIEQEMQANRELWDPKLAAESIHKLEAQGKVEVETEYPQATGRPITLTATDTTPLDELPEGGYRERYVLSVDPHTKLVTQRETYRLIDGAYELQRRQRYFDYNEPIDPNTFVLEVPEGVKLDDRTQGIGMPQGNMTDGEAARAVVRRYLEALVANDYEAAGKLYNGKPADELRNRAKRLKTVVVRVVSTGAAEPQPELGSRVFRVPFAYEFEKDGAKHVAGPADPSGTGRKEPMKAMVRPVPGKPDRWVVVGGI